MVLDLLKKKSEEAARKLSNATLASSPDRASSQKGSSKKLASPTSSGKTFPRSGAKQRARAWSPGPQGKRKKSPRCPRGRGSQSAQWRRAGRSVPLPLRSRWQVRGRVPREPPCHAEAATAEGDLRRMGSQGWRWEPAERA